MKLYGIKTCDTVRKVRKYLDEKGVKYEFVDMRATPVECDTVDRWLEQVSIEKLFNKRGTTYRKLGLKDMSLDESDMREWLCRENTFIKRPVVGDYYGRVIVGFDEGVYTTL